MVLAMPAHRHNAVITLISAVVAGREPVTLWIMPNMGMGELKASSSGPETNMYGMRIAHDRIAFRTIDQNIALGTASLDCLVSSLM